MTPQHRHYLVKEAGIAAAINAALSIAFVWLMFGGLAVVPVAGAGGLIVDAVPQSLMVAMMSTLVPTLLTRRRVAGGQVPPSSSTGRAPRNVLVHALLVGVSVAMVAWAGHVLLLPFTPPVWPFATVMLVKAAYGAMLGGCVAWLAARAALKSQAGAP